MGWRAKAGREQRVLDRIVSRLLSLADLGEQAAGRSFWVRWQVLWALWYADAEVRDYVAGSTWNGTGRYWSPALPAVRYGTDPADAMYLAASFRALALVVQAMAEQISRLSFWQRSGASGEVDDDDRSHHAVLRRLADAAFSPVERLDTS